MIEFLWLDFKQQAAAFEAAAYLIETRHHDQPAGRAGCEGSIGKLGAKVVRIGERWSVSLNYFLPGLLHLITLLCE